MVRPRPPSAYIQGAQKRPQAINRALSEFRDGAPSFPLSSLVKTALYTLSTWTSCDETVKTLNGPSQITFDGYAYSRARLVAAHQRVLQGRARVLPPGGQAQVRSSPVFFFIYCFVLNFSFRKFRFEKIVALSTIFSMFWNDVQILKMFICKSCSNFKNVQT
jgi:hypothetical protein